MPCLLLPGVAALLACNPPPKEASMHNPGPPPGADARGARKTEAKVLGPAADSPAEADGRLTLSTAFVRLGAGEHLAVELRDGSAVLLRDVVMRARDYCGVQVLGASAGTRFCGGYGDVVAARPVEAVRE